ncbi:MAG: Gfo/Idh/MocA family oxidoreductase [Anaerolineae bacterium]
MAVRKNIVLAGLGPHARRIYYPLLEKYREQYNLHVALLIDRQDQADAVHNYLAGRALQPDKLLFIEDHPNGDDPPGEELLASLRELTSTQRIDGIIIATEPRAHKVYALWAILNHVDVLVDKPITAPPGASVEVHAARQVFADYGDLERCLRFSTSNVIVQAQRRSHAGYALIKLYLDEFTQKYPIPISYMDIYHGDGMWPMPDELFRRENHPFKYGYGKLMHSGYHFVDLFAWLAQVNMRMIDKRPDRAEIVARRFGPYDFLHQVSREDYHTLFGGNVSDVAFSPARLNTARSYGEQDVFALCQLKRDDVVVTTASINLQQNSFSRRAWLEQPQDVYKGNGRVRHEHLNLQIGNLLNIQAHSYQAYEVGKKDVEVEGAGHEDHFEVDIYRNSGVVGGQPLEKFDIGSQARREHSDDSAFLGHNEYARELHFLDFLERRPGPSHFSTHGLSVRLLSGMCEALAIGQQGDYSQVVVPV